MFGETEYKQRTQMAIVDWNENIDRQCTSVTLVEEQHHPRHRTRTRVLKRKTREYTRDIWNLLTEYLFYA